MRNLIKNDCTKEVLIQKTLKKKKHVGRFHVINLEFINIYKK